MSLNKGHTFSQLFEVPVEELTNGKSIEELGNYPQNKRLTKKDSFELNKFAHYLSLKNIFKENLAKN